MPQNKNRLPDYRDDQGWSNLDPINAPRTATNAEITFLKRLFTLRLRTRDAFALTAMLVSGIVLTALMSFFIYAAITTFDHSPGEKLWIYLATAYFYAMLGFFWLIGVALIVNFLINLGVNLGLIRNSWGLKNGNERKRKEVKKKLPKRRKDFR